MVYGHDFVVLGCGLYLCVEIGVKIGTFQPQWKSVCNGVVAKAAAY